MGRRCVKCGYERQPTDIAPDYECPKCGVVYAKAEGRGGFDPHSHGVANQSSKATKEERGQVLCFGRLSQVRPRAGLWLPRSSVGAGADALRPVALVTWWSEL
jgi:hypothetical protein